MEDFQTRCLDKEPKLKSFLVSPKKAHITLLVLNVEDERMEEAKSIFAQCRDHFSNDKMFEVEFSGVGTFGNRVLFRLATATVFFRNLVFWQPGGVSVGNCHGVFWQPHGAA